MFCSISWCLQIKLSALVTLLETLSWAECSLGMHRSKDSTFLPINKYLKAFTFNAIYD